MHYNTCNKLLEEGRELLGLVQDLQKDLQIQEQCLDVKVSQQLLKEAHQALGRFVEVIRQHKYSSRREQSE